MGAFEDARAGITVYLDETAWIADQIRAAASQVRGVQELLGTGGPLGASQDENLLLALGLLVSAHESCGQAAIEALASRDRILEHMLKRFSL
ncbi:MAG: hypothetical protein HKP61_16955 [Dactylosporangium sp.]|nr:hypothetical protein [Dactylosporangium sp.]NNJ62597.1 hypothetical protein [Dactylosporangium sp.]